jgi:hypothetical protein
VECWTIGEGEQEGRPEVEMAVMRLVGTEGERSSNWEELHRSDLAAMAMAPTAVERRRARTCVREEEWGALSGLSKTQEGAAVACGARGGGATGAWRPRPGHLSATTAFLRTRGG